MARGIASTEDLNRIGGFNDRLLLPSVRNMGLRSTGDRRPNEGTSCSMSALSSTASRKVSVDYYFIKSKDVRLFLA